jgi:RNA-dependent RNA polymerase
LLLAHEGSRSTLPRDNHQPCKNGVHHRVFSKLLRQGLTELVESLAKWDDPVELWQTISRQGGVLSAQAAREAGGERAKGYGERQNDDEEYQNENELQQTENTLKERSTAWWWDELSGCPSSLEETVMVLLDAGFSPTDCAVLRENQKDYSNQC